MRRNLLTVMGVLLLVISSMAMPPERDARNAPPAGQAIDNEQFIDAGNILMFVTNRGAFGRDASGVFGYDFGTFFPYAGSEYILNGTLTKSPLYAGGLWVGGIDAASGEIRVKVSEYNTEYRQGPYRNTADDSLNYYPDEASFKIYKLFRDSLADNPNQDYLDIPLGQGAPVDSLGNLLMLGDQMTWAVYNDADTGNKNDAGSTNSLGIEIRQTVWASDVSGAGQIFVPNRYTATPLQLTTAAATAYVVDPHQITGDEYLVEVKQDPVLGKVWGVVNLTDQVVLLSNQTDFSGTAEGPVVEGLLFAVTDGLANFTNFETVANAAGLLNPPEGAAAEYQGFPSSTSMTEQQVNGSRWLIHTADDGGSSGGGTRADYDAFVERVTRSGALAEAIGVDDYEVRFTGSVDNPGVNGSYGYDYYHTGTAVLWLPFELWNIGAGTPDDPSDDFQMVPYLMDADEDGVFDLSSWGTASFGGGGYEHSVSGGDNDPFTDWVYWYTPIDSSPGRSGYLAAEAEMRGGSYLGDRESEVMARMVFVNWNGGTEPPFNQDMPEKGTIFRITTSKGHVVPDSLTFTATRPQAITTRAGGEGNAVYLRFDVVNKGRRTINNMYMSLWTDPDLGGSSDDYVGCDTTNNIWFCYNATNMDLQYGHTVPATGFRVLQGPVVPSVGDTATYFGQQLPNYRNLPMTAFAKYINGTDPSDFHETYNYMQGLLPDGQPYPNGTNFMCPGDPTTGTGELDAVPADRRMMASFGPFTFRPGDSQQVIVKMAVGQGIDRLSSIMALKNILMAKQALAVSTTSLEFSYAIGGPVPAPQTFQVTAVEPFNTEYMATTNAPWLVLTNNVGVTPGTVSAAVNPTGLEAGTHSTYIAVGTGVTSIVEYVRVTVTVTESNEVIHPTDQWINLYCAHTTIDGVPMALGGTIDVLDPTGVLCGRIQTDMNAAYGFIPAYRDDSTSSDLDEGAEPGDTLRFRSGGEPVYPAQPVIWTANGDRFEVCDFSRSHETCLPLHVGWNLISWNIDTPDDAVTRVAAEVMDNVNVMLGFESGALTYDPALPKFSTLKALDHLHGYWFLMNRPDTLCLNGNAVLDNTGIPLEGGWNVAPYYPGYPMSVENAAATILDRLLVAYDFDNGIRIWQPGSAFNTLEDLHRYQGYWLKLSAPGTWYQVRSDCTMIVSPLTTPAAKGLGGDVIKTPRWVNLYAAALSLDGAAVAPATTVIARTPDGEIVGRAAVQDDGSFGFMAVYGREHDQAAGLADGDPFTLEVGGTATNEQFVWSQNGARIEVLPLTAKQENLPHSFWLAQNYPNPFNPTTTIKFSLAKAGHYCLTIYNLAGQKVKQFEADSKAGEQTIAWDASGIASGLYLYRLTTEGATASRKMLLLK